MVLLCAVAVGPWFPVERWLVADAGEEGWRWMREVWAQDHRAAALAAIALAAAFLVRKRWSGLRGATLARAVLIAAIALDLGFLMRHTNPFQPNSGQYESTAGIASIACESDAMGPRVTGVRSEFVLPGTFGEPFGLRSIGGVSAMVIREVGEVLGALDPACLDTGDQRYVLSIARTSPMPMASPLLDLLGVGWIVAPQEVLLYPSLEVPLAQVPGFELTYAQDGECFVYRNREALPPAFFVDGTRVLEDRDERLAALASAEFRPAETALLERPLPGPPIQPVRATVQVSRPTPEHIQLDVVSDGRGLLVLTEPLYPGWVAEIDGARVPLERVDHAFIGMVLEAGTFTVDVRFRPRTVWLGAAVSAAAALALLAISWSSRRSRKPGTKAASALS